ncbi:MAG: hypothetical protein ABSF84_13330 [Acidimicrobiales bacterium]
MTPLTLEQLQVGLLDLIKDRPTDASDPYLAGVAGSDALLLVREISASWRAISLDTHAPLTTTLLRQRGHLVDEMVELMQVRGLSPFHADLRDGFLLQAMDHPDPIVVAVASFEQALAGVADGTVQSDLAVDWTVDPYPVLGALLSGQVIPDLPPAPHRCVVGPSVAGGFRVEAIPWMRRPSADGDVEQQRSD